MKLNVVYFAWLRERIGVPSETIETDATDVKALVDELRNREERYALAFSDMKAVRVAIDQTLTEFDASLVDANEVAFFPPMTGG